MSYMQIDKIRGKDGGTAKFSGGIVGTLSIEITVADGNIPQYLFLDSIDTKALKEYLKGGK